MVFGSFAALMMAFEEDNKKVQDEEKKWGLELMHGWLWDFLEIKCLWKA